MSVKLAATTANVLAVLSELATAAPLVVTFVQNTVAAVEHTGQSGTDKMTAVLNATEAFIGGLAPNLSAPVATVMAAVEAFVNALVELWNDVGVFVHTVLDVVKPAKA
jgi:phage-related protein